MTEYLREVIHGHDGDYTQVWHTPPPRSSEVFRVLVDEWDDECEERHIRRIEIVADPAERNPKEVRA